MLKSQQPAIIPKIVRYSWKRSYHFLAKFMKWPLQQFEITRLTLFAFAQSKLLSCDSCLKIAVIAFSWQLGEFFPNSWDSFFRTAVTADLAAWALLIFPYLAKIKTNYWNYLSLAKILSFSAILSPIALTKSLLLESNLYNFSSSYNPIFLLSLTSISLILPYIIHITNTTSHKSIYIFYHLHTSQEIPNTHTKSPSHGRHKLLMLKPFS